MRVLVIGAIIALTNCTFQIDYFYFTQQDAPVINKTASSQNVPAWAGTTTNLSCIADGNPAPRYTWTNSSGIVATSEENGILRVTPQGNNGFGPYTCKVENNKGKDYLDVSLVKVGMFKCVYLEEVDPAMMCLLPQL